MAQIQVKDPEGKPVPRINLRIIEGKKDNPVLEDAIFDYDTDGAGNKGWPIPYWPIRDYTIHVNAADINPAFLTQVIYVEKPANGEYGDVVVTLERPSVPVPVPGPARTGVVRTEGRNWFDDGGKFNPLGGTLFWAIDGWRNDRERFKANMAFLGRMHGFDFQRILGDVGWPTQQMDSTAPDYEQVLGEIIDCAYDEFGLRTEVTVWGGSDRNPWEAARRVRNVVQSRRHKVIQLEAGNEAGKNGPAVSTLDQMTQILRDAGVPVAASCPMGDQDPKGWLQDRLRLGATFGTLHLDRSFGDEDWRFVRQAWDYRDYNMPLSNNEPKGPNSSVSETKSIPRLVIFRALSIMCGITSFVLHNGSGVTGRVDPAHNRPANLWEVPGINELMLALRSLDAFLPEGVSDWSKTTQHGGTDPIGPHPLLADAIWSDGGDHGTTRCYGATNGGEFVSVLLGVKRFVDVKAVQGACDLRILSPETNVVQTARLERGESYRIETGATASDFGYVIRGVYR